MAYPNPINLYVTKRADSFGYFLSMYSEDHKGERACVVNMDMENIIPGQVIPAGGQIPLAEGSLRGLGEYLIGQGLITAPVTDRERNDHEKLKIKYESLEGRFASVTDTCASLSDKLDKALAALQK